MSSLSDEVRRVVEEAMRDWYRYCYRIAYRFLGKKQDSEDCVQEVSLRFGRELEKGVVIENPKAWLGRVTRNVALEIIGKRRPPVLSGNPGDAVAGTTTCSPDAPLQLAELRQQVRDCIEELIPLDRQLIVLQLFQEKTLDEIASVFQQRKTWVSVRLTRAKKRLARCLRQKGVSNGAR